ncbi:MAG: hypothetical protein K2X69_15555 [Silvanigrellaceae bacterium]|nr:hypothetical protein [Silvanigrellaceae bacterium]
MLIYEYYEDINKGIFKKYTRRSELRKLLKSNYLERAKEEMARATDFFD